MKRGRKVRKAAAPSTSVSSQDVEVAIRKAGTFQKSDCVYCNRVLWTCGNQGICYDPAKADTQIKINLKPTNPKDVIGSKKMGTTVVPDVIAYYASLGLLEGALKYGTANWSEAGVRVSIYLDACGRHLAKFKAGEWKVSDTQVPHLASALACIGIILDANLRGMITDDRPPANPQLIEWLDKSQETVEHLQQRFADHNPLHYNMTMVADPGKLFGAD